MTSNMAMVFQFGQYEAGLRLYRYYRIRQRLGKLKFNRIYDI